MISVNNFCWQWVQTLLLFEQMSRCSYKRGDKSEELCKRRTETAYVWNRTVSRIRDGNADTYGTDNVRKCSKIRDTLGWMDHSISHCRYHTNGDRSLCLVYRSTRIKHGWKYNRKHLKDRRNIFLGKKSDVQRMVDLYDRIKADVA